jgi:hypothetical protein
MFTKPNVASSRMYRPVKVRKTIVDIQLQIRPIVVGCSIEKMLGQACNAMYYRYIRIILKLIKLLQGELDCLHLEHRH